jgi:hypothetical protein
MFFSSTQIFPSLFFFVFSSSSSQINVLLCFFSTLKMFFDSLCFFLNLHSVFRLFFFCFCFLFSVFCFLFFSLFFSSISPSICFPSHVTQTILAPPLFFCLSLSCIYRRPGERTTPTQSNRAEWVGRLGDH